MVGRGDQSKVRLVLSISLLALMIIASIAISAYIRVMDVHLLKVPIYPEDNRQVSSVPSVTPSWRQIGADEILGPEMTETLGTKNYVSRHYLLTRDADPKRPIVLDLHIAYYTGMIDSVPHVPERCFVGGGLHQSTTSRVLPLPVDMSSWRVDPTVPEHLAGAQGKIYTVRLSNDPALTDAPGLRVRLPRDIGPENPFRIRVSEFLNPGSENVFAGYFFIANGGTKANANEVRQLAFNLEDDYAYYMKVQFSASGLRSQEEFLTYSGDLLGELIGEIMRCVPDWVEVQLGNYPPDNPRRNGDGREPGAKG